MTTRINWPDAIEYSNMLQNPPIAFGRPELQNLQTCTIERNDNRQPRPRAGAFSTVYKGTYASGADFAIRLFSRDSGTERRDRYAGLSKVGETVSRLFIVCTSYRPNDHGNIRGTQLVGETLNLFGLNDDAAQSVFRDQLQRGSDFSAGLRFDVYCRATGANIAEILITPRQQTASQDR